VDLTRSQNYAIIVEEEKKQMVNVVSQVSTEFVSAGSTLHAINDRFARMRSYRNYLSDKFLFGFIVDNHHAKGRELHFINDYGLVYIFNEKTKKFITIIHPRSKQLHHYFKSLGLPIDSRIRSLGVILDIRNKKYKLNNA
jgi:hypothetical protein